MLVHLIIISNFKQFRHELNPISRKTFSSHSLSIQARSTLPHYLDDPTKAKNWNTNHSFVLSNRILSVLEKRCKSISQLKQIQSQMIVTGLILDGLASSRLIAFSGLSEMADLSYCKRLLCHLQNPNAFSYNIAIRACSESENPIEAFLLYKHMLGTRSSIHGLRPDNYTFPLLFKTCARLSFVHMGFQILVHVIKMAYETDVFVHNALIHFLVTFGEVELAHKVFDESSVRDLVSWNSLINGHVKSGKAHEALRIYREMEIEGIMPDEVTMIGLVSSCAKLEDLDRGREVHRTIERYGLNFTVPLSNALMDMYVKCGDLQEAKALFDKMEKKTVVSWTTMVLGYSKFGLLDTARKFLDEMPVKDVVPWNALIGGYVQAKRCKEALALFKEMQTTNVRPDEVTMVSCLSACTQLGALDVGIWIHHYIERNKLLINVALGTALIDTYAKCGNIYKALQIFKEMPARNSLTWTAIICGLAFHGDARDALSHFLEMIEIGLIPDEVTFLGVLTACCHGGLVEEGRKIFSQMNSKFEIPPKLKHYSCMVDLLGRAGLVEEAEELIDSMPMEADAVVWGALFFACRIHKNVEMGERAALKLLELDPHDSGIYVLLASMYIEANMPNKARKIRKIMRERGVDKTPGCSSIEVDGDVWEFIVRDKSHPQCDQIYECLTELAKHMELVESPISVPFCGDGLLFGSDII